MDNHVHLLKGLRLPSRYESLVAAVGVDVARLLVEPTEDTLEVFRQVHLHMRARGRGVFLPIHAPSGTGKTTLVSSLAAWLPKEFTPTARLAGGEVSADRLRQAALALEQEHSLPANEGRVVVLNVDDRESDPPSEKELSQIKGYLRESGVGSRSLIVWPETSLDVARKMSHAYQQRAGSSPVPIPAVVNGPPPDTWQGLAIETLKLVNGLSSLEDLGVDPRTYDPAKFSTVGDYLDKVSDDFVGLLGDLLSATRKPIQVIVAFVCESGKAGVLSEVTGSGRYGLLDADRLLSATPGSVIGKWWRSRTGLLVQTIVRLDARTVFIAPSLIIPIVRRYGPEEAASILDTLGIKAKSPSDISAYLVRSEFGRLLRREDTSTGEIRGNPAHDAVAAFTLLAQNYGFGSGNDKKLNLAIGDFLTQGQTELGDIVVEKKLAHLPLIPDIAIDADGETTCLEMHWRSGDYLSSTNRSEVAQYILRKLKAYAIEMGWAQS